MALLLGGVKGHFDNVFGLAWGVGLPENSIRQTLARVRENIPRHLWIQEKGIGTAYFAPAFLETAHRALVGTQTLGKLDQAECPRRGF